jgi:Domain of unknown function (DUF4266)
MKTWLTVVGCRLSARSATSVSSSDGQQATVNGQPPSTLRRVLMLAPLLLALSACGNIEPWVKPYEREALADPIMSFDAHPVSTSYTHHVFEAREGARGALGSGGGGCGCN